MAKYYAVKQGRVPGIYESWEECKKQIHKYSCAKYKSFETREQAEAYLSVGKDSGSGTTVASDKPPQDCPYAFVDGSFNGIGTGVYGYGGFLVVGDTRYKLQGRGDNEKLAVMRNVAGELEGAMAAVKKAIALGLSDLILYYDYTGIECWAKKEWKTNKPGTERYVQFMDASSKKINVYFKKIKAHSGISGNEEADFLAKQAVGICGLDRDSLLPESSSDQSTQSNTADFDYSKDTILAHVEYWNRRYTKALLSRDMGNAAVAKLIKRELVTVASELGVLSREEVDMLDVLLSDQTAAATMRNEASV